MLELFTGALLLSLLHATIPNHWAPVLAVARAEKWLVRRAVGVTAVAGLAHVLSTVGIGLALGWLGWHLSGRFAQFASWIAPGLLIVIGVFYALSGSGHAHPDPSPLPRRRAHRRVVVGLAATMFLAPCLEIQTFFLAAGTHGPGALALLMDVYLVVSVSAMCLLVALAHRGLGHLNLAGLAQHERHLTGAVLVLVRCRWLFHRLIAARAPVSSPSLTYFPLSMPDPSSDNLNEELNTAKQVQPENVGALTRAQLTPEAATAPEGHDVPGHAHDESGPAGHNHPAGKRVVDKGNAAEDEHAGHDHGSGDDHDHGPAGNNLYLVPGISLVLMLAGIALDYYQVGFFTGYVRPIWYGVAYLLVGWKVIRSAIQSIPSGNIFNEFLLMSIATIGAIALGEYAEGVAVMLFYTVGELFQDAAVNRAKRSIKALLEIQATEVGVLRNGQRLVLDPKEVVVGDVIEVKPGEKVALDGTLQSERGTFNTAALTGESVPQTKQKGEKVLAGMINQDTLSQIAVTAAFQDTKLSKILAMVQDAVGRKAKTQQFITKFARIYTPIVVGLALLLTFLPYVFVDDYVFRDWLYRALVFLVISCPCALVISIPLGYFGGIGAASKAGVLFKGSNFLDVMREIDTVVMDKTGTLTKGVFAVQQVVTAPGQTEARFTALAAALEAKSTHPIAQALVQYVKPTGLALAVENVEEISGHGLRGRVDGQEVLAGNTKLLTKFNVAYPAEIDQLVDSIVVVAIAGQYAGYLTVADEIKEDAAQAVRELQAQGISTLVMLSGDKDTIVQRVAKTLGITEAHGGLLPEDKAAHVERLKAAGHRLAFVGDGVNDAPVVALADVGIAMGGLGSDATIETADVVIQTDHPSKIATARRIAVATHTVVWQNIWLAFAVKAVVLALGAGGLATMWEAVFADVGVALLAILNAVRIQRMNFTSKP